MVVAGQAKSRHLHLRSKGAGEGAQPSSEGLVAICASKPHFRSSAWLNSPVCRSVGPW